MTTWPAAWAERVHSALRLCDRPDRFAARLYLALRYEPCDCCTFWRGVLLGLVAGVLTGGGIAVAIR